MAMNPQIIKSYAAKEFDKMEQLIFRGGKFSFYLLMFLCFPIIFETNFILRIWMGNVPEYTSLFTRLVLILSLVEVFTFTIGCAIQATGNIRNYQLIISGINMLNFPVSFTLFKLGLPPYTALSASIVISTITVLMRLYFIKHLLNISPYEYFFKVLLKSFSVALLCLIIPTIIYIIMQDDIFRFFVLCIGTWISNFLIIYLIGIDDSEKKFLKQLLTKFKSKIYHA